MCTRCALLLSVAFFFMASYQLALADGEERMHDASSRKSVAEMRRELLEWRKIVDDRTLGLEEREAAAAKIEALDDPRLTDVLTKMWDQEKEIRVSSSRRHLIGALKTIAEAGDRIAFLTVARASIQDTHSDIRRDAAIWVGTRENRDDAIPIFVKYLNTRKYAKPARTSLGYTQIPQNPQGPPDPELVAAMIDGLVEVTPVRKQVLIPFDTGRRQVTVPTHTRRTRGIVRAYETTYEETRNSEMKELLYQYTAQDLGYDQQAWRKQVLKPLREKSTNLQQSNQPSEAPANRLQAAAEQELSPAR